MFLYLHMKIHTFLAKNLNIIRRSGLKFIQYPKQLQKDVFIRQSIEDFSILNYQKCTNLKDAALFAEKHFKVKNFNVTSLSSANLLNRTFTKIYNATKGKAEFPPIVSVINKRNSRFSGECGYLYIKIIKNPYMENDIIHEIGHYNHQKSSLNYYKMLKLQELIYNEVEDFSIYYQFRNEKKSLNLTKKHVSPYATSSAAEFVACTFNSIINGKKLPPEIYNLYKEYEGPFANMFIADRL